MYSIYDRPAAIKEIQTYLRGIGYDTLPVIISGNFDDNTATAVKDFQVKSGLTETGTVGYETFTLLYDEYVLSERKRRVAENTDSFVSFPLSRDMSGSEIRDINELIIEILDYYGIYHTVRRGSYFSQSTEEGVIILQKLFNMNPTGIIDELTYERMIIERDSIFNFKPV